jgi:ketopantoate reductase
MRVAIVGAGALGTAYGGRLALLGGCDVSVVARETAPPSLAELERVENGEALRWAMPGRLTTAPTGADVILVFVRYEQLASVPARVTGSSAPIVVMTPMMPCDHALLSAALPGRLRTGMPGVVAYRNEAGATRYWLPSAATTLVEDRLAATERAGGSDGASDGADDPVRDLVRCLGRAAIGAKLATDVLARNVATTVSFIPLAMALDAAGSIDALLHHHALLSLAFEAVDEGRELGRAVGKAEPWASALLRFVGPITLKVGVGLARSRAPEALAYVEGHFGRKLHAQNVAMARTMIDLAVEKGTRHGALHKLLAELERP